MLFEKVKRKVRKEELKKILQIKILVLLLAELTIIVVFRIMF